jgi:hypothetical protein
MGVSAKDKVRVILVTAVFIVCSLLAFQSEAASCSRDCGGDCTGGCSISSPSCGVSCHGGQCPGSVTCEEFGGTVNECLYSVTTNCGDGGGGPPIENPQSIPAPTALRWAVVEYFEQFLEGRATVHPDVRILSESGSDFGTEAKMELVREKEMATAPEVTAFAPGEAKRRLRFSVAAAGGCMRPEFDLPGRFQFDPPAVRRAVFFRVVADEDGRIVAATPLFSEAPERNSSLAALLQTSGRLHSSEETPIEAFIAIVLNPNGELGYLLAGGRHIPERLSVWSDPLIRSKKE